MTASSICVDALFKQIMGQAVQSGGIAAPGPFADRRVRSVHGDCCDRFEETGILNGEFEPFHHRLMLNLE